MFVAIYHYDPKSLLDEVRIVKNATGGLRAYLHARPNAPSDELATLQDALNKQGLKAVPIYQGDEPHLEVRGLKNADQFIQHLKLQNWTTGIPAKTSTPDDKVSRTEKLRNLTLKGTGLIYNIGDVAYMIYATKGFRNEKKALNEARHLTEEGVRELNAKLAAEIAEKNDRKKTNFVHTDNTKEGFIKKATGNFEAAQLDVGGGIGYAIGGSVLSLFASHDQSQNEIKDGMKKIRQFALKDGIAIPAGSSAEDLTRKEPKTVGQKLSGFVSRHPSEILNTIYAGVGILLAAASIKKVKTGWNKNYGFFHDMNTDVRNDIKDIGLGAVTMTSALTGLLVKEKKREPGEPKHHGIARVWDWIQEKPLRATGVGYFISTMFHAWATHGKYKEGDTFVRETVKYRGVFVGANVLAETLLFLSSKGHGQGVKADDSVEKTIVASTAELIIKQPEAQQAALIERFAGYMASPDVIGGKTENIAADLRTQVAHMKQNPWIKKDAPPAATSNMPTINPTAEVPLPVQPLTKVSAPSITVEAHHAAQQHTAPQSMAIH